MMKKLLAGALSAAMLFGLTAALPGGSVLFDTAIVASAETYGDYSYKVLDDGTVGISEYSGSATDIDIPSRIAGKAVTSIDDYAFESCTSLTSITIPNSVTSIGWYAFAGCISLTSITIPNSVTSIGGAAFYNCTSLTSINVESGNVNYSSLNGVLYDKNKTKLIACPGGKTRITIPNSVTSIGGTAFYSCTSLTSITIPNSVTSISGTAFYGCTSLTSITIPNSVTSIGNEAFYGCTSLTSINVESGNVNYSSLNGVLYDKNKTKLIACPGGKTSITIPNSVTSIGYEAFYGCKSLTSITIPDSVTSIGNEAFYGCKSLTSITIPDSVTSIGDRAFYGCTSLTSITIPDSVTSIGYRAFVDCTSLSSITIPDSVTSIGGSAFNNCTSLTSITIPNSVTSIGDYAFYGCKSLTSITIPDSVTSIGGGAFYGCTSLTIKCYAGSAAETYAKANGIDYVLLKAPTTTPVSKCTVTNSLPSVFYTGTARTIDNYITVKDGSKTLKKGTDYTITYKNNIEVGLGTAQYTITGKGSYSGSVTRTFNIKPKPQAKPTVSTANGKISVKWTQDTKNTGYQIALDKTANFTAPKYVLLSNSKQYAATISQSYIKPGEKWFVKIRPYKTDINGKNVYGEWSAYNYVTVRPGTVNFTSLTSTVAKKAVVRWGTVPKGCTGVQVQYAQNSSFTSASLASVANTKTLYKTLTGLTSGKIYYVRVRPYVKIGTVTTYGTWSAAKNVKAK